jgi:hypothetical protein
MTSNVFVSTTPANDLLATGLAVITCLATFAGAVILWFYTIYTKRYTNYTKELVRLTGEALKAAQEGSEAALAETRRSNDATEESNRLTKERLEETRRMFEISQRARLVIESHEFTYTDGVPTGGSYTVRNSGNLTATDVCWQVCLVGTGNHGSGEFKALMPPINPRFPDRERDMIGPGAQRVLSLTSGYRSWECPRTPPQANNLIFLIARVQYIDGFGVARYVDACRYWAPQYLEPQNPVRERPCMEFGGEGLVEELCREWNRMHPPASPPAG